MMGNCWLGSALGNCASHRHDNPSPSEPPSSSLLSPFTSSRSSSLLCLSSHYVVPSSLSFVLLCSSPLWPHGTGHHWLESTQPSLSQPGTTLRENLEMVQTVWQCRYIIFQHYLPAKRFYILSIKSHIFLVATSNVVDVFLGCFAHASGASGGSLPHAAAQPLPAAAPYNQHTIQLAEGVSFSCIIVPLDLPGDDRLSKTISGGGVTHAAAPDRHIVRAPEYWF